MLRRVAIGALDGWYYRRLLCNIACSAVTETEPLIGNQHKGKLICRTTNQYAASQLLAPESSALVGLLNIWPAGSMSLPLIRRQTPKPICANWLTRRGRT